VIPHVPIMDHRGRTEKGIYPFDQFHYDADKDQFICPQGKGLRYWGIHKHSRQHVYRASPSDCRQCPVKEQCTRATYRSLSYHIYESSIDVARKLTKTRGYRISQIMRKRVEELFGEAKECMGLRRTKFRGALFVQEQVLLTAMAQNVKRMERLLSRTGPKKHRGALAAYAMKVSCNSYRYFAASLITLAEPFLICARLAIRSCLYSSFFNSL
jgi:hypothetical protein